MKNFSLLSILLGSVITISSSWILEYLFLWMYCPTGSLLLISSMSDEHLKNLPALFYISEFFLIACASFIGGTIPLLIGEGHLKHNIFIGCISTIYAIINMIAVPFPLWYKISYILIFYLFATVDLL